MKNKSSRNKTIEITNYELNRLSNNLIHLNHKVDINEILNKTICQDLFEIFDYLPDNFVDLLFVDPPYNMNKKFGSESFKQKTDNEYERWINSWLIPLKRILKQNATIYICGDWKSSTALYNVLVKHFYIQNRITWEREKGRGSNYNWKNSSEDIWFVTNNKKYYFNVNAIKLKKSVIAPYKDNNGNPKDWRVGKSGNFRLTYPSNLWTDLTVPFWSMSENTTHPTQKPEKLLAKLILASTKENDVIFDPFLGSGTTSVVTKKLGRNYVGVERDKYYACITEKRLEMIKENKKIQGYCDGIFLERNSVS